MEEKRKKVKMVNPHVRYNPYACVSPNNVSNGSSEGSSTPMLSGVGIIRLDLSKDDDAISSIVTLLKEVCSFTDEDDKKLKKTKLKEATKLARILLDKTADCSIVSI